VRSFARKESKVATTTEKHFVPNGQSQMAWSDISQPGAYVSISTGKLYRVPALALKEGHSPVIDIVNRQGPETVVCLSTNPYTPIEKLRLLCADADIEPNF
jgi:hypothetical protein